MQLRKHTHALRRIMAVVLTISMILQLIPYNVYATGENRAAEQTQKTYTSEGCTITYKENSTWGTYVNAEISITNNTEYAKSLWSLNVAYEGNIDSIWNADITHKEDNLYIITCKDYNNTIPAGQTVTFGFIAYGQEYKPNLPENIAFVNEQNNDDDGTEVSSEIEIGNTKYKIPQEWEGLKYAVFTSGSNGLTLDTNTTRIGGSVHTNQAFFYQGNTISIDGVLKAAKGITINTSSGTNTISIKSRRENVPEVVMPDITGDIYRYIQSQNVIYETDKSYGENNIIIDNPIGVNGSIDFNSTTFTGRGIIYATDNITYNAGSLATPDGASLFVVSEKGNITLDGTTINLNAVLYAPNGTVTVNANEFHLNGRIIAKEVNINGTVIEINAGAGDFAMLEFLFDTQSDIKRYDIQKDFAEGTCEGVCVTTTESYDYLALEKIPCEESMDRSASYETSLFSVDESFVGSTDTEGTFSGCLTYDFFKKTGSFSNAAIRQNHAYAVSDTQVTWEEARKLCEDMGGHLIVIDDAEENEYIRNLLITEGKDGYVSIGYTDEVNEGRWQWVNGSDSTYTNWDAVEPNNGHTTGRPQNHAHMYSDGTWDDGWECDAYYVCEWDRAEDISFYDNHTVILKLMTDASYLTEEYLKNFKGTIEVDSDGKVILTYKVNLNGNATVTLPVTVSATQKRTDIRIIENVTVQYLEDNQVKQQILSDMSIAGAKHVSEGTWEVV
ncbi:MAG: cellulose binding domain-containing protein, partial [Lachnospira sp.]|nr:cellulose binding domain-containing protein [Lachnospira sp.]